MLVAERGIRFIKLVAVCIFIFVQCNILVKKVSKPVVLLTILFNCAADTIRYDKLIVVLYIFPSTVNHPLQNSPTTVLCKIIAVILYFIGLPSKSPAEREHNQSIPCAAVNYLYGRHVIRTQHNSVRGLKGKHIFSFELSIDISSAAQLLCLCGVQLPVLSEFFCNGKSLFS